MPTPPPPQKKIAPVIIDGIRYQYLFRHEPNYVPKRKERPRGVHGRTMCSIKAIAPSPICPVHVNKDSGTAKTDCLCRELKRVDSVAHCSRHEPIVIGEQVFEIEHDSFGGFGIFHGTARFARFVELDSDRLRKLTSRKNPQYDPAMGRLEAFTAALVEEVIIIDDDGKECRTGQFIARQEFPEKVRKALWLHFLTNVNQPINVPAAPARRTYRKLTVDEATTQARIDRRILKKTAKQQAGKKNA